MSDISERFQVAIGSGATLVEAPSSGDSRLSFARSVAAGLSDEPKWLHCRFLYDAEGSRLFELITEQPEYYPTRTEAAILAANADEIREITGPVTLVELGSGYSVKTEYLLSAYARGADTVRYVPVDVSSSALREASQSISESFADVEFTGITGTYTSALPLLRQLTPQLVAFLGSTIGNFNEAETATFWRNVASHLPTDDFFLLGVDLEKEPRLLEAAYNDKAGVTARFTNNYFARMNRELGSRIELEEIDHVAVWNPGRRRMEIYAHFRSAQKIDVEPLGQSFEVAAGERILLEISRKYRLADLEAELRTFGFQVERSFTDDRGWFALLLLKRVDDGFSIVPSRPSPSV